MKIQEFLKLVGEPGRTNYFVVCPDDLGLNTLLPKALRRLASPEDYRAVDATDLTKERARQLERECRLAPRASSDHTHFFVSRLQKLNSESVGPLLKAAEEAKYARFIFQAQFVPRKIQTLMSRSSVVRLPFLSKSIVLANIKAMNYDAKTVDHLNLYDGTLGGTVKALQMKDTMLSIRREMSNGMKGLPAMMGTEVLNSLAFEQGTADFFLPEEQAFLRRSNSLTRKKLVVFLALSRRPK